MREGESRQVTALPCAACKLLRRRCSLECIFAPYFPADQPQKFVILHRIFGASNVNKMLQELPAEVRADAVSSMVYEANARVRDPVYGCAGAISSLQRQVDVLQSQLAMARAEAVHLQVWHAAHLTCCTRVGSGCGGGSPSTMSSAIPPAEHLRGKRLLSSDMVVELSSMGEMMWSC